MLVIPISTVASEFTFSTGGRILDEHKSSMTPDMVQALILMQNWLQSSLFVDSTTNFQVLVEENEFMDVLTEGINVIMLIITYLFLRLVLIYETLHENKRFYLLKIALKVNKATI